MAEEENKQKTGGIKGMFSGIGGLGGWFSALMGRPRVPEQVKEQPQQPIQEPTQKQAVNENVAEEDSIAADIKGFKTFMGKTFKKVSTKATPVATQGKEAGYQAVTSAKSLVDKSFLKKLVRIFLILVFLIILVFIVLKLFRILKQENNQFTPPGTTPSPAPYIPYKPSVYAEDPEILQLEEDINILEQELSNTSLREERLDLPDLDFDVRF